MGTIRITSINHPETNFVTFHTQSSNIRFYSGTWLCYLTLNHNISLQDDSALEAQKRDELSTIANPGKHSRQSCILSICIVGCDS